MIKTILASLTGLGSDKTVLDAAVAIAKIDGAHIECLHTRIDAIHAAAMAGATEPKLHRNLGEMSQKIAREEQERSQHSLVAFQDACKRHSLALKDKPEKSDTASASMTEVTTFLNETLDQARFYDLVVLARESELSPERIHTLVVQAGRPVLVAPAKPTSTIGQVVAVAWKNVPEAARALAAALPILLRAKRVVILSVSEDAAGDDTDILSAEGVAKQLRWHGVSAEVQMSNSPVVSTSKAIQEMAYAMDADLLVMGAYSHSRMRELIFGGATRDILADCAIPVLMFH